MALNALTLSDIAALQRKAVEARALASTLEDEASVTDLLCYASALEADIKLWEEKFAHNP